MHGDPEIHTCSCAHQGENIPLKQVVSPAVLHTVDQSCII